jgi:titin
MAAMFTLAGCDNPANNGGGTTSAPDTPTNVTATAQSPSSILISWSAPSSGGTPSYYNIFRSTSASGQYTEIENLSGSTTSYANSGLSASTTYYYKVEAENSAGKSPQSSYVSATTQSSGGDGGETTVPDIPTDVTALAQSANSIVVSWAAVSGAASYTVYYKTGSSSDESVAGTATGVSYTHAGLQADTTYSYRVKAANSAGESDYSISASATTSSSGGGGETTTPGTPTGVTAVACSDTAVLVTWNAVSGALGYRVYYETASSSGKILSTGGGWEGETGYYVYNLAFGTSYAFYVTSMYWDDTVNASAESPYSSPVFATTMDELPPLPDDPSNVEAVANSTDTVTVTWSPAPNAADYEVSYWAFPNDDGASYENRSKKTTTDTSITITGLEPGVYYGFEVIAVNASGRSPGYSGVRASCRTEIESFTITAVAQSADNSILVSWDDAAWIAGCTLYYREGSGVTYNIKVDGASYTHTGLSAGKTYYYYIWAEDSHGVIERSNTVSATIVPTPTGLTAGAGSGISITLSWITVSGATGYKVEYQTNSSAEWTPIQETVTTARYTHSGLTEGITYAYRVKALINSSESGYSATVSRTAWPAPNAPTNVTAALQGTNSISVSWGAVAEVNGYNVEKWSSNSSQWMSFNSYTTTSFTDSNLSSGTYRYRVRAYNNNVSSGWVTSNDATVSASSGGGGDDGGGGSSLPAPTGFSVSALTSSDFVLTWNSVSGAALYRVYKASSNSGPWTSYSQTFAAGYNATGLSSGTTYYFKVSAIPTNSNEEGALSATFAVTTSTPGGGNKITLNNAPDRWAALVTTATLSSSSTVTSILAGGSAIRGITDTVYNNTNISIPWVSSGDGNGTYNVAITSSSGLRYINGVSFSSGSASINWNTMSTASN